MELTKKDFIMIAGEANDRAIIELAEAIEKHGLQNGVSFEKQFLILMEEIGEVAKDLIEDKLPRALKEVYQVIAMCYKLAAYIKREIDPDSFELPNIYDPNNISEFMLKLNGYKSVASIGYMRKDGLFKDPIYNDDDKLYLIPKNQMNRIKRRSELITTQGIVFFVKDEYDKDPELPFGYYNFGVVK